MHPLIDNELYQAISYAKSIDEHTGREMLQQFQQTQPALAQTLLEIFPSIIASQEQNMAYLFMDLCFDVLCIFQKAFGPLPSSPLDPNWLANQSMLLETELHSLLNGQNVDPKIKAQLQKRMQARVEGDNPQPALLKILLETIDDFAAESPARVPATQLTQTLMTLAVRLIAQMYMPSVKAH